MSEQLEILRSRIDEIDEEILNLLNHRMSLAVQIGRIKADEGKPVVDVHRENAVIEKLSGLNSGILPDSTLRAIFREIFSGSRSIQRKVNVAYLGPQGTHSHEAAVGYFGESTQYTPCHGLGMTFNQLASGRADFAVVPAENTVEGSVRETLDLLLQSQAKICGELCHEIRHCLASQSGRLQDVKRVVSHPQALAQCRAWLTSNLPCAMMEEAASTARAAERAAGDRELAAVAGERAAGFFGLQIIERDIQDSSDNITRFFVLSRTSPPPSGSDRTSLVFWVENRPGALAEVLQVIAGQGINVTKIESRPQRGPKAWEYAFFVDLIGHSEDPTVRKCLDEIEKKAVRMKIFGSYPIQDSLAVFPTG